MLCGVEPQFQELTLFENVQNGAKTVATLDSDAKTLGDYGAKSGMRLHVHDRSGRQGAAIFEDMSAVPKYTMTEEDYDKRESTYRKFKEQQARAAAAAGGVAVEPKKEETVADYPLVLVGKRCALVEGGHRGEVAFFGVVEKKGLFVGVRLDEPFGKNDGSADGKRYFESLPKYGIFVKPNRIQVGEFPPVDDEDDDDE